VEFQRDFVRKIPGGKCMENIEVDAILRTDPETLTCGFMLRERGPTANPGKIAAGRRDYSAGRHDDAIMAHKPGQP
jgi:hypothetical protein